MRIVLDTNIVIDLMRGDESLKKGIELLIQKGVEVFIDPIVLCELYQVAHLSDKPTQGVQKINNFLSSVDVLDFNKAACMIFGQQVAYLQKQGKPTEVLDLMIGCIAITHNASLVTRNSKDFKHICGLKVIGY